MDSTAGILDRCLADLAARIDEEQEAEFNAAWDAFLNDEIGDGVFVSPSRRPAPPQLEWPTVNVNDALHDPDLMLLQQFGAVSGVLARGGDKALGVRCNYGVGIMASQLGCDVVEMPREQGNTPTARPLGGMDAIEAAIQNGMPDLRAGQGADVFDTGERFLEAMQRYPVLGRWVALYHPDAQGPIDNAELAWGSDIFLAFYDCPERVHAFLDLMTEHYIAFMRKWFDMVPPRGETSTHWVLKQRGQIMLRDDSLMNLPPDICNEFIRDREERCLLEFGGGAIHYCGRGDHYIETMSGIKGLTGVNLSQPHLNDMPRIYANTIDKGIPLLGFSHEWASKAARPLLGRVHVYAS